MKKKIARKKKQLEKCCAWTSKKSLPRAAREKKNCAQKIHHGKDRPQIHVHRQCCCFPWSKNIECIHRHHRILSSPISLYRISACDVSVPFAVRLIGFPSIIMKYKCSFFRSQQSLPDLHTLLFFPLAAFTLSLSVSCTILFLYASHCK